MERQEVVGTVAQFRDALHRARNTFMGCECCGYLPVPREDLAALASQLGEGREVRWGHVDQVPNSIVFMVPGVY